MSNKKSKAKSTATIGHSDIRSFFAVTSKPITPPPSVEKKVLNLDSDDENEPPITNSNYNSNRNGNNHQTLLPPKTSSTNSTPKKSVPKTPEKVNVDNKTPERKSILQTPPKTPITTESLGLTPSPNKNYKYINEQKDINENYNPIIKKDEAKKITSPTKKEEVKVVSNSNSGKSKSNTNSNSKGLKDPNKKETIFTSDDEEEVDETMVNKKRKLQNLKRKHESPVKGSSNIKVEKDSDEVKSNKNNNINNNNNTKNNNEDSNQKSLKKVKIDKPLSGISPPKKIQKSINTPKKAQLSFVNSTPIKTKEELTDEEDYSKKKVSVKKEELILPSPLPMTRTLSNELLDDSEDTSDEQQQKEPEDKDTPQKNKPTTTTIKSNLFKEETLFDDDDYDDDDNKNNKNNNNSNNKKDNGTKNDKFNENMLFDTESDSDSDKKVKSNNSHSIPPVQKQTSGKFPDDFLFDQHESDDDKKIVKNKKKSTTTTTATATTPKKEDEDDGLKANRRRWFSGAARLPPPNLNSKPLPIGAPNCLKLKTFHFSGTLDSTERETAESLVTKYGGLIAKSVTKKTNYLVKGEGFSDKKIKLAGERKAKIINEDEFFELISSSVKSSTKNKDSDVTMEPISADQLDKDEETEDEDELETSDNQGKLVFNEKVDEDVKMEDTPTPPSSQNSLISGTTTRQTSKTSLKLSAKVPGTSTSLTPLKLPMTSSISSNNSSNNNIQINKLNHQVQHGSSFSSSVILPKSFKSIGKGHHQMWVDKYKPQTTDDLIGNENPIKELKGFLTSWLVRDTRTIKNDKKDKSVVSSAKNACLISGPPGIGKTTAVLMLCKELGYDSIELNASDTRSKNEMKNLLEASIDNKSITNFFSVVNQPEQTKKKEKKMCIILDEIDGSSGNEDRGGVAEIISAIKVTKIPFICICNDYYSSKLKTLKSYCVDIKFRKPTVLQAAPRLLQIAKNEGMALGSLIADKIYNSTNSDLRQSIHLLQMLSRKVVSNTSPNKSITFGDNESENFDKKLDLSKKDFEISPFTGSEKLMTQSIRLNTIQKLELFFTDFSLVPLLIQENYLSIQITNQYYRQRKPQKYDNGLFTSCLDEIDLICLASDSISSSDLIDREIHKHMSWELLPTHGILSSLIPTHYISGAVPLPLAFPSFLGKYSNAAKQSRFIKDLQLHMRVSNGSVTSSKNDLRLHILPMLTHYLTGPLSGEVSDKDDAIKFVMNFMDKYGMTEDDRNNILELSTWKSFGNLVDPVSKIDKKIKTAFTRKWRSTDHAIYDDSLLTTKKSKSSPSSLMGRSEISDQFEEAQAIDDDNDLLDEEEEDESNNNNNNNNNILNSSLIKSVKKK